MHMAVREVLSCKLTDKNLECFTTDFPQTIDLSKLHKTVLGKIT